MLQDCHEDDRWYVRQCLAGKQDAFAVLVKKYERSLLAMARRMVKNEDDARDLVQEAFLKAYQALANYQSAYAFSTWLYRITINLCLNFLEKRRVAAFIPEGTEPPVQMPMSGVEQEEFWEKIEHALAHLSPLERSAFVLSVFEKIPVAEIAQIIACPKGTVCWLLFQARKKLQSLLNKTIRENYYEM